MSDAALIWSYLARDPLLWLTLTLIAYSLSDAASRASGRKPIVNPVLIAVILLATVIHATGTTYRTYFEGAQFVHFMLGPATVALAAPLFANIAHVRRAVLPMAAGLLAGSLTAMVSALLVAKAFGIDGVVLASLAAKSTTAPVAIGISEKLGGAPTLTAVIVLLTGVIGAVLATPLLNALRVKDWRARGFAVGVAAHGTARPAPFRFTKRQVRLPESVWG